MPGTENDGTAGRSFYTSLGHTNDTWKVVVLHKEIKLLSCSLQDQLYLGHVIGGILWATQSGTTTQASNATASVGAGGGPSTTTPGLTSMSGTPSTVQQSDAL